MLLSTDTHLWTQKILKEFSDEDKKKVLIVKANLNVNQDCQCWYYAGARSDLTFMCLVKAGSSVNLVDYTYSNSFRTDQEEERVLLEKMFLAFDSELSTSQNWDDAFITGRQDITFNDHTSLKLYGCDVYASIEDMPDSIDIIFTNDTSPLPSLQALSTLKVGGKIVYLKKECSGFYPTSDENLKFNNPQIQLKEYGFNLLFSIRIDDWIFDQSLFLPSKQSGLSVKLSIFQKTREFTSQEEEEISQKIDKRTPIL